MPHTLTLSRPLTQCSQYLYHQIGKIWAGRVDNNADGKLAGLLALRSCVSGANFS